MATLRKSATPRHTKRRPPPTAATVMTCDPETIGDEGSLMDAASRMAELGVRHLPVVDDRGVLVGMLSDRDIRAAIGDPAEALRGHSAEWGESQVLDVMTPDPTRAELETPVAEIAAMLTDERIGAVPVVDEGDRPVGIVSYVDLIGFLAKG